ncbi:P-loop containing nucleoside triphosphate hydrolase protein [Biscogniauxia marginata]|nr:P-loop containing nucleoside triphosphate hydrolase protein [Biscogniauxia marginata]
MGSMVWSEEEARYFRALLSWDPSKAVDDSVKTPSLLHKKPHAGEFRVLIIGAKGCGKTSLLTRFCQGTFPRSPEHQHGCRHRILVEEQPYILNILEFPPEHLPDTDAHSHASLVQAIRMTDAAVLVYDVRRRDSFALLQGLHDVIYHELGTGTTTGFESQQHQNEQRQPQRRDYALALVGTKCDGDDDSDGGEGQGAQCQTIAAISTVVSWAEGYKLARGFRVRSTFVEASARTGENVEGLFAQLGRELVKLRRLRQQHVEVEVESLVATKTSEVVAGSTKKKQNGSGGGGSGSGLGKSKWRLWARPCFRG